MDELFDNPESRWHVQIVVNGGLEYDAELTADQIAEVVGLANKLERNTAYDRY